MELQPIEHNGCIGPSSRIYYKAIMKAIKELLKSCMIPPQYSSFVAFMIALQQNKLNWRSSQNPQKIFR